MLQKIKLSLLFSAFFLFLVSCEDDNGTSDLLPPEEAQEELSDVDQSLSGEINNMRNSEAFTTLQFFNGIGGEFIDMDLFTQFDQKTTPKGFLRQTVSLSSKPVNTISAKDLSMQSENKGVFEFNFENTTFELIDSEVDYLEFIFPSNEVAFAGQENNAILRIDEFLTIEDNDLEIPVEILLNLEVNDNNVLSLDYNLNVQETGQGYAPQNGSVDMSMSPYSYEANFTLDDEFVMTSSMNYKTGDITLMSSDIQANFDPDLEWSWEMDGEKPQKIEGYIQTDPIKYEGSVNALAIEEHMEKAESGDEDLDIDYLNEQLNIDVVHTDYNQLMGHLEFYTAIENDNPELYVIVVFEDDTWEFFENVMPALAEIIDDAEDNDPGNGFQ